jgi:hypothetical protein
MQAAVRPSQEGNAPTDAPDTKSLTGARRTYYSAAAVGEAEMKKSNNTPHT